MFKTNPSEENLERLAQATFRDQHIKENIGLYLASGVQEIKNCVSQFVSVENLIFNFCLN